MAVVGITSRSSEKDVQWLMEFIRRELHAYVSKVEYLPITNRNIMEWRGRVNRCSVGILYHTKRQGRMNITDVDGALYDEELQSLYRIIGRGKVLVVLDDLEDCSDSERQRILAAQPSLKDWSSQILLFPERGKIEEAYKKIDEFLTVLGYTPLDRWKPSLSSSSSNKSSEKSQAPEQNQNPAILESDIRRTITSTPKIYIFSRATQSNYDWLVKWLKTTYRMRPMDVYGVYISNKSSSFYSELQHCSFAILYHTQKQGQLQVTDAADSLYDEELTDLSKRLGKENVIVVIDDLKNTDSSEKTQILGSQPSIGRLARDLFLFNEKEKNTENLEKIKQFISKETPKTPIMDTGEPSLTPENVLIQQLKRTIKQKDEEIQRLERKIQKTKV